MRAASGALLVFAVLSWSVAPPPMAEAGAVYSRVDEEGVIQVNVADVAGSRGGRPAELTGSTKGWLRVPLSARGARWKRDIHEVAERYGVDPVLVHAVIDAESAFNPWAVSAKGAQGLMQLMPRTASALGVRDSFNPRENIEGGVRHLRYLLDRYPADLSLVLAAYNAGEGAVDYYGGIPPFPETQQYVQRILRRGGLDLAAPAAPTQAIYRFEDPDGTVTFSNIPPAPSVRRIR
jgi:soluble lytic murein transglycosylase-like protein